MVILAAVDVGAVTGALVHVEVRHDHLVHHLQQHTSVHKSVTQGRREHTNRCKVVHPVAPTATFDSSKLAASVERETSCASCSLGRGTLPTIDTIPVLIDQWLKQINISNADYGLSAGPIEART